MSKQLLPALSDAALIAASSRAIFGRGQTYAAGGAVGPLAPADAGTRGVAATVEGTQPYDVQVWVDGDEVAGDCDCPNAADGWFCKHQVALALAWRAQLGGEAPAAAGGEEARKAALRGELDGVVRDIDLGETRQAEIRREKIGRAHV